MAGKYHIIGSALVLLMGWGLTAAGPCDSSPCQNGALCISRQYSYWEFYLCRCQPPGEYFGRHCETKTCLNGGTATNYRPRPCNCPEGFITTDIRCEGGCASDPCQNNGICTSTGNDFTCQCPEGYSGIQCESQIPQSLDQVLECGDYGYLNEDLVSCSCIPGFVEDPNKPNSCIWANIDFSTQRTESVTPAIPGGSGNGCSSYPCLHQGSCQSYGGSHFQCFCGRGYTGRFCESFIGYPTSTPYTYTTTSMVPNQPQGACASYPCYNQGTCSPRGTYDFMCYCRPQYSGRVCELATGYYPETGARPPGVSGNGGGRTGATGMTGPQGSPGSAGSPGPPGPAGPNGPRGPTGPRGVRGADGQRGPDGASGARYAGGPMVEGQRGVPGGRGRVGVVGEIGTQGPAGSPGDRGVRGSAGAPGFPGRPGSPGQHGATGAEGRRGATGEKGYPGRSGPVGPPGVAGRVGQGNDGFTGATGATGGTGNPGPTGPRGPPGNDYTIGYAAAMTGEQEHCASEVSLDSANLLRWSTIFNIASLALAFILCVSDWMLRRAVMKVDCDTSYMDKLKMFN